MIVVSSLPIPGIFIKDCSTFPLNSTYSFFVLTLFKYADIPPTFSAIDILLSFKITIRFFFSLRNLAILFNASYAIPPDKAPSPITATIVSSVWLISLAVTIPSAADKDMELCPLWNASQLLSFLFGNPLIPWNCRRFWNSSFLPVKILCT